MVDKQNNLSDIRSLLSTLYILEVDHILNASDTGITKYNVIWEPLWFLRLWVWLMLSP